MKRRRAIHNDASNLILFRRIQSSCSRCLCVSSFLSLRRQQDPSSEGFLIRQHPRETRAGAVRMGSGRSVAVQNSQGIWYCHAHLGGLSMNNTADRAEGKRHLPYGIVVLVMGTLVVFGALGLARFGYSMLLAPMQAGLGMDNTQAGLLATANLVGYLVLSVPGGALASRYGPRAVIAAGLALAGAAMILTGLAGGMASAAFWRGVTGLGSGAVSCGARLLTETGLIVIFILYKKCSWQSDLAEVISYFRSSSNRSQLAANYCRTLSLKSRK